ncbi:transposase [Hymenobacter amundsenii]|uniref:Transposase n=1 Tax=Hymenobacter amundsenii TaxID=2006685 RepID=A0A246FFN9_9BACT|nr:transposase [Hymenobacter amundsenii]OWP61316.1 transposase [Hymenobacter amundsenii]
MKVTVQLYGQFLLSSHVNYTGTYLAEHLAGLTHDNVQYFLKTRRFTPRQRWQQLQGEFVASERGYVLFDDTVLDKSHSHHIALVRRQYSGNAHGLIKGIGLVNCVYVNPDTDQFWLLDYRLFAPEVDGKDKHAHVRDMLMQLRVRQIAYRTVLMDSWYATTDVFKWLIKEEKLFYCPLKSNRLVDDSGGQQPYQPLACLNWSAQDVAHGKLLKVKKMPQDVKLKCFRVLVSTHRTDYLVTNELAQDDTAAAEQESNVRWLIEQFHREAKQLTGLQACQCRLARSQRNHISLALRTWTSLKRVAYQTGQTVYQLKQGLLDDYLRRELAQPTLRFA